MNFLDQAIQIVQNEHKSMDKVTIVVPSQRAIWAAKKTIVDKGKGGILPHIISIEEFSTFYSGIEKSKSIELLLLFWDIMKVHFPTEVVDDPQKFVHQIHTLLADFSEVDRNLSSIEDALHLLNHIEKQENWAKSEDSFIEHFYGNWEHIQQVYPIFKQALKERGIGYSGLILRQAKENISNTKFDDFHYFLGFNALTQAEEEIIKHLISQNKAQAIWDCDSFYMKHPQHQAGFFLRKYREDKVFKNTHFITSNLLNTSNNKIHIIHCASSTQQYLKVWDLIKEDANNKKTAVIFCDENNLPNWLYLSPLDSVPYNVTMGLALSKRPLMLYVLELFQLRYKLFQQQPINVYELVEFEKKWSQYTGVHNQLIFNHQAEFIDAIPSTSNLFFLNIDNNIDKLFADFYTHFVLFVAKSELEEVEKVEIIEVLESIQTSYASILEEEYLFHLLLPKMLQELKVDLLGDKEENIQVMGLLESRLLDFDRVIFLDVNEGIMPKPISPNTYLPFDLRKHMGLSTYYHNDSIFAYHFYRLLTRSKESYIFSSPGKKAVGGSEPSRFITQIKNEMDADNWEETQLATSKLVVGKEYEIHKSDQILEWIKDYFKAGISASAISNYCYNPMDFLDRYILKSPQERPKGMQKNVFGNIIHAALEESYLPFLNQEIATAMLPNIRKTTLQKYQDAIAQYSPLYGENYIYSKLGEKSLVDYFDLQKNRNPYFLKGVESKVERSYFLKSNDLEIHLKGIIDRVEEENGVVRIVDFKTGKVKPNELKLPTKELDVEKTKSIDKIIQFIFYGYLSANQFVNSDSLEMGICSLMNHRGNYIPFMNEKKTLFSTIEAESNIEYLLPILEEILDPKISFKSK